jgi:hypothetical protein
MCGLVDVCLPSLCSRPSTSCLACRPLPLRSQFYSNRPEFDDRDAEFRSRWTWKPPLFRQTPKLAGRRIPRPASRRGCTPNLHRVGQLALSFAILRTSTSPFPEVLHKVQITRNTSAVTVRLFIEHTCPGDRIESRAIGSWSYSSNRRLRRPSFRSLHDTGLAIVRISDKHHGGRASKQLAPPRTCFPGSRDLLLA